MRYIKKGRLVSMIMGKPAVSVFKVEENPDDRYSKFLQNVVIFYKTTWSYLTRL